MMEVIKVLRLCDAWLGDGWVMDGLVDCPFCEYATMKLVYTCKESRYIEELDMHIVFIKTFLARRRVN
jgi:hypothetical protein